MSTTLSTPQWQRLRSLFNSALDLDPAATTRLIDSLRSEDPALADALADLLSADARWNARTADIFVSLAQLALPSAIGSRLGAYRVVAEIGRGGMGVVYQGERVDGLVQHQVAIKILPSSSLNAEMVWRFEREREILAAFDHPGIARLFDAGITGQGEPYYVMEYVQGQTIDAYCRSRQLSPAQRLQLFLGVCEAVQYAHGNLVLHRDIKAANVLVDANGLPRLIDFGIAKSLPVAGGFDVERTAAQHRFFSPRNAAPEQVRGSSTAVACDVYQLGTLLYELLCGQPVFDLRDRSAAEIERLVCEQPPTLPSAVVLGAGDEAARAWGLHGAKSLSRHLRGDLDAIVLHALQKEPSQRYKSVEHLADDIRRHMARDPVHARNVGRVYRVARYVRRHWRPLGAAALVLSGLLVFTWLLQRQSLRTAVERDRAVAEARRAESVTQFLTTILTRAASVGSFDPPAQSVTRRRQIDIDEVLAQARAQFDQQLQDPLTKAKVIGTLAEVYASLDDLDNAADLIVQSVRLREQLQESDTMALAQQMQRATGILFFVLRFDEAVEMADRSIALFEQAGKGVEVSWYAQAYRLRALARHREAESCARLDAITDELRERHVVPGFITAVRVGSRCSAWTPERLKKVEKNLLEAEALILATYGGERADSYLLRRQRAEVVLALGRPQEAKSLQQSLLTAQTRLYGKQSWHVAFTLQDLGMIARQLGDFAEAERRLLESEKLFQAIHGDRPHRNFAVSAHEQALLYEQMRADPAKITALHARATEIARIGCGPGTSEYATFAAAYASWLIRSGSPGGAVKAEALLRESVTLMPADLAEGAIARVELAELLADRDRTEALRLLRELPQDDLIAAQQRSAGLVRRADALRARLDLPAGH
ncbi:MAG TPA: serine/threonine-protein kinase [Tahibacter sp.]|uniref:serine/threonine-protein kinase n=1 Tax=Tahibacter sp. TaxID=2056211 RepID=UPI002BC8B60F|nr:serine/threonine-protein kinase [Tahibacter sp.]HSX59342.1 serine/threonine-protein kinase [Tahibacter sp.]